MDHDGPLNEETPKTSTDPCALRIQATRRDSSSRRRSVGRHGRFGSALLRGFCYLQVLQKLQKEQMDGAEEKALGWVPVLPMVCCGLKSYSSPHCGTVAKNVEMR